MLIESNNQKVLALIFKYPTTGLTVREIARKLKISPPTASRIAKDLERKNLVIIKKESNQYKVLGNVENEKFKDLKRIYNLFSLLSLKDFLIKELNPNLIIVFGSYSTGEDIENSDIDLFVDSQKIKEIDLSKFEKKLARGIHLIVERFHNLPSELRSSIINGVI
ncbi:MAG: MarR family transcriptional regulator, partial [Candidatus Aenigmarchaeota archaeon]|nr:MarR family transcriptional regulator [Candidatus Aenigmarchaeota archaeon]